MISILNFVLKKKVINDRSDAYTLNKKKAGMIISKFGDTSTISLLDIRILLSIN